MLLRDRQNRGLSRKVDEEVGLMIGIIVNLWKMVRAVNEKGFCSVLLVLLGDGPTSCAVPPAPILKKYVMSRSLLI